MNNNSFSVSMEKNPIISINVHPGHFTTSNKHSNYYLDVSSLKSNALIARDVARELALPHLSRTIVNTIVCMENTKVIGAYMAEELLQDGPSVMNSGGEIHVITPMSDNTGKLVFYDNEVEWVTNKSILLLTATISSGRTLDKALDCLTYYGGKLSGISALFMVASYNQGTHEINTLFTSEDIPDYQLYDTDNCALCAAGVRLDALISSEGFSSLKN